jgi:hypothetical protein
MTEKETQEQIRLLRKWTKKVCISKKSARKFLMKAGIIDKEGNLTPQYRQQ